VRTPFGRFNGALAGVRPDDLASYVIKALLERHPHLDGGAIAHRERDVGSWSAGVRR
jgi:acetyl-CoA acyltransferase